MAKNFVAELEWRGMIHDIMPETEKVLKEASTAGYIGFDPTADSLHIGSLVQIMILMHFQKAGHSPIALIGGATGMIGDPSGKSQERNLLDKETLEKNVKGIETQLSRFLDFDKNSPNAAKLVNNYDWMSDFSLIDFARDIGKHLTVNYMMAKDSVKSRLESGMSFTEFSYQLVQGYDFYWLWKNKNCKVQLGGSDQWGNIVTGTELIRRKGNGKAFAVTTPLIQKSDGGKFGKTEYGNVWLDKAKTSVYKFYQFWLNSSDIDAKNYIQIFTLLSQKEILKLIKAHDEAPHLRILQNTIANEITIRVHSKKELEIAKKATNILFGKSTENDLKSLDESTFLSVFEGVPTAKIRNSDLNIDLLDFLVNKVQFFDSKGEARRMIKANAVSINKEKITESFKLSKECLINNKYIVVQKGKKNYSLVVIT